MSAADDAMGTLTAPQKERFWTKVDTSEGPAACWPWTGAIHPHGYGTWTVLIGPKKTATLRPHRLAWTLTEDAIPTGLTIDHLCKNKLCCNPQHLEVVTQAENNRRVDRSNRRDFGSSMQNRKRKDGSIAHRVMFRAGGAQVGETFDNAAAAEAFRDLISRVGGIEARRILEARNSADRSVLFGEYLLEHVERLTGVTDGTRKDYKSMLERHVIPSLGQYPIDALERRQLEEWVNRTAKTMSSKTLRNVHALLSAALNRAVYEGIVPANLAKGVRLPSPDHNKVEMVTLTPNEFVQLLAAFPEHWQPLIATLAGTGMRWGEATALMCGSVDLDSTPPTIRVQQAWKRTGKSQRELGAPKTRKGRRTISLSSSLVRTLRPLVEGRPADALVFTALEGGVIHHGTFYPRVWKPALAKAKLSKRPRIHDLRHTHVTWMLAAGVPLVRVQRRLGHEDITTTVNTYGHAMPDDLRGDAQAIEEALAGALPEMLAIEQPSTGER